MMEEAGWTDVVERRDVWPGGRWPKDDRLKELGIWTRENLLIGKASGRAILYLNIAFSNEVAGLEGFSLALLTRVLGWSNAEVQVFLADVRKDIKDPKIHFYIPLYTVYGRKPE